MKDKLKNFDNIPGELKKLNRWVNWKWYEREGKWTKPPINAKNGRFAKSNNPDTWSSYSKVVEEAHKYDGIGFILGDGYIGVDIDNKDKEVQEYKQGKSNNVIGKFIEKLGSYAEYSPSGNGIHIIGKGKKPEGKCRTGDFEVYDETSNRYFTVTGNIANNINTIENIEEELKPLYDEYIKDEKKSPQGRERKRENLKTLELDDDEVINLILNSKQSEQFKKLYSGNHDKNLSEVDLSMCNILAFWTGKNFNQIDRIFRGSKLMREKWEREDYKERTINKAINDTTDVYYKYKKDEKEKSSTGEVEGISVNDYSYVKPYKNGALKYLSTFIISLNRVIINIENNKVHYDLDIFNDTDTTNIIMDSTDFNNKNKFMNHLNKLSFSFYGNQNELQEIKHYISKDNYKTSRSVNFIGIHYIDNKRYFISDDKAITSDLEVIDNITLSEDRKEVKTNILDTTEASRKDLEKLGRLLYSYNQLSVTSSIIGTVPIMLAKPLLCNARIYPPHLMIYGESGSGKSRTTEDIINQFFNLDDSTNIAFDSMTKFTLHKSISSSNNIPVIIEEYKPSYSNISNVQLVSNTMRYSYDGTVAKRGRADQTTESYPLLAPIILVGEEGQEETAIKERSIILNFSKAESYKKDRTDSYFELEQDRELLNRFGRTILNHVLNLDMVDIKSRYISILKETNSKISTGRVAENISMVILGNYIIQDIYNSYGLDLEKLTNVSMEDITSSIINSQIEEIFDGGTETKSNITRTLEVFSLMASNGTLIRNEQYTIIDNSRLAFHMDSTFEEFIKYINRHYDQTQKKDLITNKSQFRKQLKAGNYMYNNKTATAVFKPNVTKSSYQITFEKLESVGIDTNNFTSLIVGTKQ